MTFIMIFIDIVLAGIVGFLAFWTFNLRKKLDLYNNLNQKINGLNVLQEFMSTAGETMSVEEKINKINNILIEEYGIKYSTIVEFNGTEYIIRASNVDQKHWDNLRTLHNEDIFKDSITTATPKYITTDEERDRLPYQKSEFGRAKSAMFFPLYIDNIYIGYWIIESGEAHAFDDIDTTILEVVKDNIVSVFKIVNYQNIVESLPRDDKYSSLKTGEYLFNDGRKEIDQYEKSTICMFKIINLERINEKYNRATGNQAIIDVCDYIKNNLSSDYVFVRYMGPKFVIAFSGVEIDGVAKFIVDLKKSVEKLKIEKYQKDDENQEYVNVKLNFVLATYYKGTAIERLLKDLEEYLDNAPENESDINQI